MRRIGGPSTESLTRSPWRMPRTSLSSSAAGWRAFALFRRLRRPGRTRLLRSGRSSPYFHLFPLFSARGDATAARAFQLFWRLKSSKNGTGLKQAEAATQGRGSRETVGLAGPGHPPRDRGARWSEDAQEPHPRPFRHGRAGLFGGAPRRSPLRPGGGCGIDRCAGSRCRPCGRLSAPPRPARGDGGVRRPDRQGLGGSERALQSVARRRHAGSRQWGVADRDPRADAGLWPACARGYGRGKARLLPCCDWHCHGRGRGGAYRSLGSTVAHARRARQRGTAGFHTDWRTPVVVCRDGVVASTRRAILPRLVGDLVAVGFSPSFDASVVMTGADVRFLQWVDVEETRFNLSLRLTLI